MPIDVIKQLAGLPKMAKIEYLDPDLGAGGHIPFGFMDLLLVSSGKDRDVTVNWDDTQNRYSVKLYSEAFGNLIEEKSTATVEEALQAVCEFAARPAWDVVDIQDGEYKMRLVVSQVNRRKLATVWDAISSLITPPRPQSPYRITRQPVKVG